MGEIGEDAGIETLTVWPTLDPAVKLKLGAEFAENENGFALLSLLLLLLLLDPNWKGCTIKKMIDYYYKPDTFDKSPWFVVEKTRVQIILYKCPQCAFPSRNSKQSDLFRKAIDRLTTYLHFVDLEYHS